jgi:endonuclease YncB( thermonuclease family)
MSRLLVRSPLAVALSACIVCVIAASAAILPTAAMQSAFAAGRKPSDVPLGDTVRVSRVIDAATIEVILNGAPQLVKYLGIDAPTGDACQAGQATATNRTLVEGKLVRLERDTTVADDQGRLLRYVYVLDGRMAQEELLAAGLARAIDGRPDVRYYDGFVAIEESARVQKQGGWSRCDWQPVTLAPVVDGCTVVAVERMIERRAQLPELARVAPGDCVRIHKAANAAGPQWAGDYTYQPAGAAVTPDTMYLRWKDGFLLIRKESDGAIFAHVVRDSYKSRIFPWERGSYDTTPGATRVSMQALIPDTADPSILVLPNPRTFLFRDLGNGQWQPLVDAFIYRSGDARAPRVMPSGEVE